MRTMRAFETGEILHVQISCKRVYSRATHTPDCTDIPDVTRVRCSALIAVNGNIIILIKI